MSIIKQLAGETAIYGISSVLSRVLHFVILTPYLTRIFKEQAQYGIYSDLYVYAAFLLVIFTYRMETAYFRFGSSKESESVAFSTASLSILCTTTVLLSLMLMLKQPIAAWLKYASDYRFVSYFAWIIALDALAAIPFAQLRLSNRPLQFAKIKIFGVLLNLGLIFFFLELCPFFIEHGYLWWSHIYQADRRLDLLFISNLIASACVLLLLIPTFFQTPLSFSSALLRRMLGYSFPLVLVGIAAVINQSAAAPLIKYLRPGSIVENLAEAGIYAAAAKLAILMNLFTQAFNYAAEPFFFKQSQAEGAKSTYSQIAQAFALAASLGLLVIYLFLDIFQFFLGQNYREGLHVVPYLLLAYWFLGLYYNFSIWYKLTDKTHYGAWISLGGAMITFGIAFLFLRQYGIQAMAWAAMACYAFMAIAGYLTGQRHHPIPYPVGKISLYLVLAVSAGLGALLVEKALTANWQVMLTRVIILMGFCLVAYWIDRPSVHLWLGIKSKT